MAGKPGNNPMRWGQLLLCGWPGLPQLWLRGSWSALSMAIGFTMFLNLAIVSSFVWPSLLGEIFPAVAWPTIVLVWLASTTVSMRMVEQLSGPPPRYSELERNNFSTEKIGITALDELSDGDKDLSHTLFNRAQHEYLMGHLTEAESLLKRRLIQAERDIEARLLLATMFRHTERFGEASDQLKQMEKFDDAVHWAFEIDRERQLIQRDSAPQSLDE